MGLSIGVHLLNLLAIPALAYIFYFRRYRKTGSGVLITALIGMLLLGFVQFAFIPKVVGTAAWFELLFTNSLGMGFGSGAIVYILSLIVLIVLSLKFSRDQKEMPAFISLALLILLISGMLIGIVGIGILAYFMLVKKDNFRLANTLTICITVMLIGYASYGMIIIRSSADTPMDENNPENVFTLLSYLNREQYGTRPLVYGQYYNAPLDNETPYKDGNTVYAPDRASGKYIVVSTPKDNQEPNYDKAYCTIFPRMWSSQPSHIRGYKNWAEIKNDPKNQRKPSFGQNLKYFFRYQLGFMYFRYFAWNYVGRVNDIQGQGTPTAEGGWKSGIAALDEARLGSQNDLPPSLASNRANNSFYFLPLLLGLIGLVYQYRKERRDFLVVMLFFFFTGIAIILFLNQYTNEPRERDYGFAASFYAFAIWIGLGVAGLIDLLRKYAPANLSAALVTVVSLLAVPGIMAKEGWDDHDRSDRFTARDYAANYLNSCAPNAILFTNGDNDTFPLWYAQEVEGIRTDVRVVNLSLLNTDWYIDQIRRKAYDSDPVPVSFKPEQYRQGKREQIIIADKGLQGFQDIREMISFVASEDPNLKFRYDDRNFDYFPSNKFSIPVDSATVLKNGTVPGDLAGEVVKSIDFTIDRQYVLKADLMILDLLAHNNWKRPVYFAITVGDDSYLGLQDYFQLEGLAYRLVPVKNPPATSRGGDNYGRVETDLMYKNVMEKFKWGGVDKNLLFMDENNLRMTMNLRSTFDRLASSLLEKGRKDSALKVLDLAFEVLPERNVPYNFFVINLADNYYKAGAAAKGDKILKRYAEILNQETMYYFRQKKQIYNEYSQEADRNMSIFNFMLQVARRAKRDQLVKELSPLFDKLESSRPVSMIKPDLGG
jgi:MFS family permease